MHVQQQLQIGGCYGQIVLIPQSEVVHLINFSALFLVTFPHNDAFYVFNFSAAFIF